MVKEEKKKQIRLSHAIKNYIKELDIDYDYNEDLNLYIFSTEGESRRIYDVVFVFSDEENWLRIMLSMPVDLPPSCEAAILHVLNKISLQEIFGCLSLQPNGMMITNSLFINTSLFCPDKDFFDTTIDDLADTLDMAFNAVDKLPNKGNAHLSTFNPLSPFGGGNDNMEN